MNSGYSWNSPSGVGFWQSCVAAFGLAPFICCPRITLQKSVFEWSKIVYTGAVDFPASIDFCKECVPKVQVQNLLGLNPPTLSYTRTLLRGNKNIHEGDRGEVSCASSPRVAIIGGGIAGVTAANAIAKKFHKNELSAKIVIFEGDVEGGHRSVDFDHKQQPIWLAATARNANSIVPGAAMHVMSQRSTLLKIAKDTCREFFSEKMEQLQSWLQKESLSYKIMNIDNFDIIPPYFALHLFKCIGPSATSEERATFFTFLRHFLAYSIFSGEAEANERGRYIQQLARSNRFLFLEAINNSNGGAALSEKIGIGKGFISLHRSQEGAMHALHEGVLFGEKSVLLSCEAAIELEPRISNLPMKPLYAVHRIDDYTANSAVFVKDLVEKVESMGVEYLVGHSGMIQDLERVRHRKVSASKGKLNDSPKPIATASFNPKNLFRIKTEDGITHDFEYIVLAAGVNTPLLARKLDAGDSCPTYPLRGYSLTAYTDNKKKQQKSKASNGCQSNNDANLLKLPISVDDMYCSSVGGNMARMAGFGELVGYRDKAVDVPSLAPKVMARYVQTLFPESNASEGSALQCFRPLSPDDIPLVGEVSAVPGLFLHTGHGTLGWTLCLATSECIAQDLSDMIRGNEKQTSYNLPGDIVVDSAKLSPDRFLR